MRIELAYPHPPLRSDRVLLRKWSTDDLECVEKASEAGYSRGSTLPVHFTVEDGRAWIKRQWQRQVDGSGLSLAIADIESDVAIGMIYVGLRGVEGHGTLGYWLVPELHRQGLGTEAVMTISRWLLHETPVYRLVAYVEPRNSASIALLRRCGFTEEGLLRSYLDFEDGQFDALCFSLLKTDLQHGESRAR